MTCYAQLVCTLGTGAQPALENSENESSLCMGHDLCKLPAHGQSAEAWSSVVPSTVGVGLVLLLDRCSLSQSYHKAALCLDYLLL